MRAHPESHRADLAGVRRLWHELVAVFWFVDSDRHYYLQRATWHWWQKLDSLRKGRSAAHVKDVEGDIEKCLRQALERFAKRRQRWECWLCKELGTDVRDGVGVWCVRVVLESHFGTFQSALEAPGPAGA